MPDVTKTVVYDFRGSLWLAPAETPMPTYAEFYPIATAPLYKPADPWVNTGYAEEAGPNFETKNDTNTLRAWQSFADVRLVTKAKTTTIDVNLLEWSKENVMLAMGLVDDGTGLLVPTAATIERAMLIIVTDGATMLGIGMPRAALMLDAKVAFKPADWALLPIKLSALQPATAGVESFVKYLPTAA